MGENEGEEMNRKDEDEEENGRKINGKKVKIEKDEEEEDLKEMKDERREQNIFDRMGKEVEDLGENATLEINSKKSTIKRRKNGKLTTADNKKEQSNLR